MKAKTHTAFLVQCPVQGAVVFSNAQEELTLSMVYWQWVYDELKRLSGPPGTTRSFVEHYDDEESFDDASRLVERIPITEADVRKLELVDEGAAPSFDLLVAADGCEVPSAREVVAALRRVWARALREGAVVVEID